MWRLNNNMVKSERAKGTDPSVASEYFNLPVKRTLYYGTDGLFSSKARQTRLHVETRYVPISYEALDFDTTSVLQSLSIVVLVAMPTWRTVWTYSALRRDQQKWCEFLVRLIQCDSLNPDADYIHPFRPARITARDPVLVEILQAGLGGAGTTVELVGADDVVYNATGFGEAEYADAENGTPLVAIMDGMFAEKLESASDASTNACTALLGLGDNEESPDAAVKKTKAGGWKLDRSAEERPVPKLAWACGYRHALSHEAVMKCARCGLIYCGLECQKMHWLSHKPKCRVVLNLKQPRAPLGAPQQISMPTGSSALQRQRRSMRRASLGSQAKHAQIRSKAGRATIGRQLGRVDTSAWRV